MDSIWCIYVMECYRVVKVNELEFYILVCIFIKKIVVSEKINL